MASILRYWLCQSRSLLPKVLPYLSPKRSYVADQLRDFKRLEFGRLSDTDINHFGTFLKPHEIITDEDELQMYNKDWLGNYKGNSKLVLKPGTTEQVSNIMKYCSKRSLAVCPQGGNTGLVGGSVPVFDEIIVSTANMNNIINFDDLTGILTCEAGCVLENLQNYVSDNSYTMPLDLGAKGSCQIGGNVATNAGGLRLVRYGSLRGTVLGLEVVLPSGDILDCMSTMRKDNTGYDLKQLFIGSEGTLGIITKVSILCPPKPNSSAVVFLGLSTFDEVLQTFRLARNQLAEILSSIEFMDHECILLTERNLKLTPPLSQHSFYMLIEVAGAHEQHDTEKLENFLTNVLDKGCVKDGILASDSRQIKKLWQSREGITESLKLDGHVYKYDVSVPLKYIYELVTATRKHVGGSVKLCCGFGHLGDGNLHLNLVSPNYDAEIQRQIESFVFKEVQKYGGSTLWECRERLAEAQKMDGYVYKYDVSIPLKSFQDFVCTLRKSVANDVKCCVSYGHIGDSNLHFNVTTSSYSETIKKKIEPYIFECVQKLKGSISAEHGIGQKHRTNIKYSKNIGSLQLMKSIKEQFDPKGILNPYKIFDISI